MEARQPRKTSRDKSVQVGITISAPHVMPWAERLFPARPRRAAIACMDGGLTKSCERSEEVICTSIALPQYPGMLHASMTFALSPVSVWRIRLVTPTAILTLLEPGPNPLRYLC